MTEIFIINVQNKEPIELSSLFTTVNSIEKIYKRFNNYDKDAKFLINKISEGSIIIELISLITYNPTPLISDINNIIQFNKHLHNIFKIARGEEPIISNGLPIPSNDDFKDGKTVYNFSNCSNVSFYTVNSDSKKITSEHGIDNNNIEKIIENFDKNIDTKNSSSIIKELFTWSQTGFNKLNTGNKGTILTVSDNSCRVIFKNDDDKEYMTNYEKWQDKGYIIDCDITFKNNKPILYKITKVYKEDTYDIKDD